MYRVSAIWLVMCCVAVAAPVERTDSRGVTVRLEAPAKRVLSLAPSHTEWVFALGAGERLVGRTPSCDRPAEAAKVASVGQLFPPDYEAMIATRPDLVLMLDGSVSVRQRLEKAGLKVFVWQPASVDSVLSGAADLGALLGVDPEPAVDLLRKQIALITPGTQGRRATYVVWPSPLRIAGPNTFAADLIRRAGGQVASVSDAGDWPTITLSQLAANLAPDVLVMAQDLKLPPVWSKLPVVANGPLCRVPSDLLLRPSPRIAKTLAKLAACL